MSLTVRKLEETDWKNFKAIRLEALKTYPNVFLSNLAEEREKDDDYWRSFLTDSSCALFGAYDGDKIVGLTAIFTWKGDETGQSAILAMSYRKPEYRGRDLGKMFYDARLEWAKNTPQLQKIRVSHREGNAESRGANQRAGFEYVGKEMIKWPDGKEDWEHLYELDLRQLRRQPKPEKLSY